MIVDFTEFDVLELFWDRQKSLFLCIGLAQIWSACFFLRLGSKLPCLFPISFYFLVRFRISRTPFRSFSCFISHGRLSVCLLSCFVYNLIRWHLKLLTRALVSDACFLSILVMYINVVPDEVIWTVNWWHYSNYEPISRTSSTRHLFHTKNVLGNTLFSYGWCKGIPRVVHIFRLFSERFASERLSYWR